MEKHLTIPSRYSEVLTPDGYIKRDLLKGRCSSYVNVIDENAVYHIDHNGHPVLIAKMDLERDDFNPLRTKYRNLNVYDKKNKIMYHFYNDGSYHKVALLDGTSPEPAKPKLPMTGHTENDTRGEA